MAPVLLILASFFHLAEPRIFSIHAGDFSAEWRLNVLRCYSSRSVEIPSDCTGRQTVRIYLLDPGIVL